MRTRLCVRILARSRTAIVTAALLAGLQFGSVAPAAQNTTQGAPPVTGPYRIAGQVVNAITGEPVRRATVSVLAEADSHLIQSVLSDADGRFVLDHLPADKYPLTASKRGYRTAFYDEHDEYNTAIVTGEGQDTANLVFRLTPSGVIYGVVTADGGDPVEGASVLLFERSTAHAEENKIIEVDAATTDDSGAYEFANLAAGDYLIAISALPWYAMHGRSAAGDPGPLDVAFPVTYFDSTIDEASATPIALSAGARQEADIAMHAVPALRLQVDVPRRSATTLARPELRKMIFGMQVSAESSGFLDAIQTGATEFNGLAPGRYELTQGNPPRVVSLDLSSNEDVDANTGVPAVGVSGVLLSSSGAALPESATVTLEPAGEPRGRATLVAPAHNGEFHFDTVEAGTWSLTALSQAQPLPVIGVAGAGKTAAVSGNQLTVRDQPVVVTAIVSTSLARVQGFARKDGKGASGAMIMLVPRQPANYRALLRRDQSDSDGSFALRDVPAGQYSVIAIEDGWKLDWTNRETMLRYLASGEPVTVPERPGAVVNLTNSVPVQAR